MKTINIMQKKVIADALLGSNPLAILNTIASNEIIIHMVSTNAQQPVRELLKLFLSAYLHENTFVVV